MLLKERQKWLIKTLRLKQFIALKLIGMREGWDPVKAIWTWGYFQDTAKFLKEIDNICQAFFPQMIDSIPYSR